MKLKKKNVKTSLRGLLAVVLTLVLLSTVLVGCASSSASATAEDAAGTCGSGVEYSYSSTTKKLTISGSGDMTDYAKAEDAPWYSYRAAIEKIEIGENVKSIGDYAFYHCYAAEEAEIEATALTSIGKCAFWMCTVLEEIVVPETVTEIGDSAFAYCTTLTSVSVSNLSTLGASAFMGCTALEVASFDGAISAIPAKAFMNCTALTTVAYPDTVTASSIAEDAFANVDMEKLSQSVVKSEATLTITYVDEAGAELAPSHTEVLAKGTEYSVKTPELEGYTIPAGQETLSGIMPGADVTLKVVYKTIASETTPVETEDEAETTAEPSGGTDEPKDNTTQIAFLVIFVVILVAIAVGAFLLFRSSKNVTKDSQTVRKTDAEKRAKKNKNKKK